MFEREANQGDDFAFGVGGEMMAAAVTVGKSKKRMSRNNFLLTREAVGGAWRPAPRRIVRVFGLSACGSLRMIRFLPVRVTILEALFGF